MNKLFDRKPETERLISFLSKETEIRLIHYDELVKAVANGRCKNINDIRAYLSAARRIMRSKYGVKYGTVRSAGIQRMTADEVALYGNKRPVRARRLLKEGLKDNSIVAGNNTLSAEARAVLDVNNVMFVKIIHELEGIKKMIKVATQDDAAGIADIFAAMNGKYTER